MARRPTVRAMASLVVALLAAGAPFRAPLARADDGPKVAVAPFHVIKGSVDESLGIRVADVIADELKGQDGLLLAAPPPPPSSPAPDAAATPEGAKAALAQIDKGIGLVKRLKLRTAVEVLSAGIQDYESFPAQVDIKKLREAYIQLAVAHSRQGENDEAGEALESAARIAPEVKLAGNFPPVFKKQFNDARRKIVDGAHGALEVAGQGDVEVDGRKVGPAPTKVDALPTGSHFVRATRPDGSVWGVRVLINEGDNSAAIPAAAGGAPAVASKGPTLTADAPGLADIDNNQLDQKVLAAAGKLAKELGADYVVVGGVYKSGDGVGCAAHLYSARTKGAVALTALHFDADLVSAGIEAHKLAAEVASKISAFPRPGEPIPSPVAQELVKTAVAAVEPVKKPDTDETEKPERPVVVRAPDEVKKPDETSKPDLTTVHRSDSSAGGLDQSTSKEVAPVESHAWIWAVAGGVALAGAAVGGYLIYKSGSQPVTGTAQLNFQ